MDARKAGTVLNGTVRIGKLAGIPLLAHWTVGLMVVLVSATLYPDAGLLAAIVGTLGFLASILAHELAHAIVARRHGVGTTSIELWALGGMARLDREAPSPRADGWIAAAGPLSSLLVGVVTGGVAYGLFHLGVTPAIVATLGWLALINGILAVFNLLPGAPLDGGRILRAWRWGRHGDRFRATHEAGTAGQVLGWGIAAVALWLTLNGYSMIMLVLTGMFIAVNARAESAAADVQRRLFGTTVRDLTWFGVAEASPDTDAETMLWQRSRLGDSGVVALRDPGGELAGMVAEEQLERVPEYERHTVPLSRLMVPMSRLAHASLDEDVTDVLGRINPMAPIVTVWERGKLVGVVPAERLRSRVWAAARSVAPRH